MRMKPIFSENNNKTKEKKQIFLRIHTSGLYLLPDMNDICLFAYFLPDFFAAWYESIVLWNALFIILREGGRRLRKDTAWGFSD